MGISVFQILDDVGGTLRSGYQNFHSTGQDVESNIRSRRDTLLTSWGVPVPSPATTMRSPHRPPSSWWKIVAGKWKTATENELLGL